MTYQETIQYLYNRLPVYQHAGSSAYKEGLDNILALDQYFGHPHNRYRTIHVGGTNGKGSTSHLLAAILRQSGYKVGLYTSPHLLDFRERIRVDGEKISEEYVVDFVAKHKHQYEKLQPSFFEVTTMMAFCYFADKEVDLAIIEVGLGGRLDSTNIVSPIMSVITNISFDHTLYLGDTLAKIAGEKAGIIKPHIPVVIGEAEGEVRRVFEKKASDLNAPVIFAQDQKQVLSEVFCEDGSMLLQTKRYPDLKCELGGLPQVYNAATVLTSLDVLLGEGIALVPESVYEGFSNVMELTGLMGRWQIIKQSNPRIICDTGHNTGGIKYVVEQLAGEKYDCLHMIVGMVNDKDIGRILELLPHKAKYYFTRASVARALDATELKAKAEKSGLNGNSYLSVKEALTAALSNAEAEDLVFIGGSNFVVAEALEYFER